MCVFSEEEETIVDFRRNNKPSFVMDDDIAGLRKKKAPVNTTLIQKGMGGWEKHTKGIGAKLLLQVSVLYFSLCKLNLLCIQLL